MTTKIKTSNIDQTTLETIGGGPKISNVHISNSSYGVIDDTAVGLDGGYIIIEGTGFDNGCQVVVGSSPASAVTFISAEELRVQVPGLSQGTYVLHVINPDGANAMKFLGLNYSGFPTWSSNSTQSFPANVSIDFQLSANGDAPVSYSLQPGSSLPTGLSLASNGLISGLVDVANETMYTFTVEATDNENQNTPRTFNLTIIPGVAINSGSVTNADHIDYPGYVQTGDYSILVSTEPGIARACTNPTWNAVNLVATASSGQDDDNPSGFTLGLSSITRSLGHWSNQQTTNFTAPDNTQRNYYLVVRNKTAGYLRVFVNNVQVANVADVADGGVLRHGGGTDTNDYGFKIYGRILGQTSGLIYFNSALTDQQATTLVNIQSDTHKIIS